MIAHRVRMVASLVHPCSYFLGLLRVTLGESLWVCCDNSTNAEPQSTPARFWRASSSRISRARFWRSLVDIRCLYAASCSLGLRGLRGGALARGTTLCTASRVHMREAATASASASMSGSTAGDVDCPVGVVTAWVVTCCGESLGVVVLMSMLIMSSMSTIYISIVLCCQ